MHGKAVLFGDEATAEKILQTSDPGTIKALGRQVKGFQESCWKKHREDIVYQNNVAKFLQNDHLLKALLETKGILVEASPSDRIWGIGLHEKDAKRIPESRWKGLNLLGKILTQIRHELSSQQEHEQDDENKQDEDEQEDEQEDKQEDEQSLDQKMS